MMIGRSNWQKHKWKWAMMAGEGNPAFQEVFVMASPAESIKLLHWCVSSVVPSHYISKALVVTVQLGNNAPATSTVLKLEESTLWHLLAVQDIFLKLLPYHTSLAWSPLYGAPLGAVSIYWVPSHLHTEKSGAALPAVNLTFITARKLVSIPKMSMLGVITALNRAMITHQN